MSDSATDPSSLVLVAIANTFALSSSVYIAASVSGGHVNPAVTFGLAVGGHISVPTALFYWVSQMLASVMACLLLKVTTVSQVRNDSVSSVADIDQFLKIKKESVTPNIYGNPLLS